MHKGSLKIAIIAGEESGDLLGADLIKALKSKVDIDVKLIGLGGVHLESLGLQSQFDPDEIALMGLGAVLKKLPSLMAHIRKLARFFANEKPDCLIVIDSPDFTHRVAKKLRKINPDIPIIQYIAPSVWAWRPERAKNMRNFIDHVLVILPFEKKVMAELDGPPATYVGHRLLSYTPLQNVIKARAHQDLSTKEQKTLVLLPGSRRLEIRRLIPVFAQTLKILKHRTPNLHVVLPTLPKIVDEVRDLAQKYNLDVDIVVGEDEKWQALMKADAALAASGTVSLELAVAKIPMVLCYKVDLFTKLFIAPKITIWSAALPNIIADWPVVPEYINEFARPGALARQIEQLINDTPLRKSQLNGFEEIAFAMKTDLPSGDIAADVIINML